MFGHAFDGDPLLGMLSQLSVVIPLDRRADRLLNFAGFNRRIDRRFFQREPQVSELGKLAIGNPPAAAQTGDHKDDSSDEETFSDRE